MRAVKIGILVVDIDSSNAPGRSESLPIRNYRGEFISGAREAQRRFAVAANKIERIPARPCESTGADACFEIREILDFAMMPPVILAQRRR